MSLPRTSGLFRLTRDAELRYTSDGKSILKLGLVCSEKFGDKENTLFLDAVAFGKPAEIINSYAGAKGNQIFLIGKLQTESWQDNNGNNRSKISMVIEGFDFVNNKQQSTQQPQRHTDYQHKEELQQHQAHERSLIPEINIDEDRIPF